MNRTPDAVSALVAGIDVRNNAAFFRGTLLVDAAIAPNAPDAIVAGRKLKALAYTRCNGFACVVCAGLGCPIPASMTANQLFEWFPGEGGRASMWREVPRLEAIARVKGGFPVVIVAKEVGHGHVAIGVLKASDPDRLYCAAAGAVNSPCMLVEEQFGELIASVRIYTHD